MIFFSWLARLFNPKAASAGNLKRQRKFTFSSPHGDRIRGAASPKEWMERLDEVDAGRAFVDRLAAVLRALGHLVTVFHENSAKTKDANLAAIAKAHNEADGELNLFVHLNDSAPPKDEGIGTETFYLDGDEHAKELNARLAKAIADAGGFKNRGAKPASSIGGLYVLNQTKGTPGGYAEVCFVSSKKDIELFNENFEAIVQAVAKVLVEFEA